MRKRVNSHAAKRELMRKSLYHFVREMWDTIISDKYEDSKHIRYICDELQTVAERVFRRDVKDYDLLINIPPGTSKTTICTIMLPVWCWINDPSMVIITGSYSADLAKEKAGKSKDILQSAKFASYFPEVKLRNDKNNKTLYENKKKGQRITTSTGGTSTGLHAHLIIVDDPISAKQGFSDAEQTRAAQWLDSTLSTRMVDKDVTPLIVIMQRLSQKDPSAHLLSKKDTHLRHICLPAELSEDVRPAEAHRIYTDGLLDPKRLSRRILNSMLSKLGEYGYAGQMSQKPVPMGGGIIKKAWFGIMSHEEFVALPKQGVPVWNFYIDGAYSANTSSDPSAFLAATIIRGTLYIRCAESERVTSDKIAGHTDAFVRRNGYTPRSIIKAEPKSVGTALVNEVKRDKNLNIIEYAFPETSGILVNHDKTVKVMSCVPFINAGRVVLIKGMSLSDWIEPFLDEVTAFPTGAHDDRLDTLTFAIQDCIAEADKKPDGIGRQMWG